MMVSGVPESVFRRRILAGTSTALPASSGKPGLFGRWPTIATTPSAACWRLRAGTRVRRMRPMRVACGLSPLKNSAMLCADAGAPTIQARPSLPTKLVTLGNSPRTLARSLAMILCMESRTFGK